MRKSLSIFFSFLLALSIWYFFSAGDEADSLHENDHAHHHHKHDHEHEDNIVAMSEGQLDQFRIEIQKAGPGLLSSFLQVRGKVILHPDQLVHVLPKISGVAYEVKKNIGDKVAKGEVLAVLESKEMADIKANFLASSEKERLALTLYEREKYLYNKKITPEMEYLQAKSSYEEAKINNQLAKQKLKTYDLHENAICCLSDQNDPDLRFYEVRSPIAGVIINRHICVGEFVEDKSEIYQIANLDTVWIEIGIFPQDVNKVNPGQIVHIKHPGTADEATAKLIFVSPLIQEETITAKAIATLDNKKGLWRPGTFVTATIETQKTEAAIVVPKDAVQVIEGNSVVFAKVEGGFEIREVQVGESDKNSMVIVAGLEEGEEFVAGNAFLLKAEHGKGEAEHEH